MFRSSKILKLATKRGLAIKNKDDENRLRIENKIVKTYNEKFVRPLKAYVIFEKEEGYQRALRMTYKRVC